VSSKREKKPSPASDGAHPSAGPVSSSANADTPRNETAKTIMPALSIKTSLLVARFLASDNRFINLPSNPKCSFARIPMTVSKTLAKPKL
jgi:hypothetical protein